jgi:hypothetical protein
MYQKVKRRLLVAVILMAIFVLSPLVSATTLTISEEKRPPQVVSHSENLSFDWDFNIPSDVSEYDYTIQVFNKTSIVWNKPSSVTPNELGERICGRKSDIWPVSDDISEGRYTIKIEHRDGFAGGDFDVSEIKGNLTIIKFNDTNRNGHKDSGEEGLAGWTFTVKYKDNSNVKSFVMTTGSDGSCTRPNLGVRNYSVTEEKRRCWTATTATNKTAEVRDFGNYEVGTLKITKYDDTNNNSEIDDADEKLPGWDFQVTDPDGKTSNYTTDGNGEIKIDVPFGTYTVKEQLKKDGWIAITPIELQNTMTTTRMVKGIAVKKA